MWKGHILRSSYRNTEFRPTSSLVRGAIFDILGGSALNGARVWDLCSGTGAFGIEALSCGASACLFVDIDKRATSVTKRFLKDHSALACAEIVTADVLKVVTDREDEPHIVFLDPPYDCDEIYSWAERAGWTSILAPDGMVFVESSSSRELSGWDSRRYGDTTIHWLTGSGS